MQRITMAFAKRYFRLFALPSGYFTATYFSILVAPNSRTCGSVHFPAVNTSSDPALSQQRQFRCYLFQQQIPLLAWVGGGRDQVSSGRGARTGGPASAAPAGGVSRQGREEANTAHAGKQWRRRCFCDAASPYHHCPAVCRAGASMGRSRRGAGSWYGVGRVRLRGDGGRRGRVSPVRA